MLQFKGSQVFYCDSRCCSTKESNTLVNKRTSRCQTVETSSVLWLCSLTSGLTWDLRPARRLRSDCPEGQEPDREQDRQVRLHSCSLIPQVCPDSMKLISRSDWQEVIKYKDCFFLNLFCLFVIRGWKCALLIHLINLILPNCEAFLFICTLQSSKSVLPNLRVGAPKGVARSIWRVTRLLTS